MARPENWEKKGQKGIYVSQAIIDRYGKNLSDFVERAARIEMNMIEPLDTVKLKVESNLNSLNSIIMSADGKALTSEEKGEALELIAKVRRNVMGLEGQAYRRRR